MDPAWARSLRNQCAAAGVPFLFKQWGSWQPNIGVNNDYAHVWPDGTWSHNVGKGSAGRLLDGREHNGMPQRRTAA
jgi:protein gp37